MGNWVFPDTPDEIVRKRLNFKEKNRFLNIGMSFGLYWPCATIRRRMVCGGELVWMPEIRMERAPEKARNIMLASISGAVGEVNVGGEFGRSTLRGKIDAVCALRGRSAGLGGLCGAHLQGIGSNDTCRMYRHVRPADFAGCLTQNYRCRHGAPRSVPWSTHHL